MSHHLPYYATIDLLVSKMMGESAVCCESNRRSMETKGRCVHEGGCNEIDGEGCVSDKSDRLRASVYTSEVIENGRRAMADAEGK